MSAAYAAPAGSTWETVEAIADALTEHAQANPDDAPRLHRLAYLARQTLRHIGSIEGVASPASPVDRWRVIDALRAIGRGATVPEVCGCLGSSDVDAVLSMLDKLRSSGLAVRRGEQWMWGGEP